MPVGTISSSFDTVGVSVVNYQVSSRPFGRMNACLFENGGKEATLGKGHLGRAGSLRVVPQPAWRLPAGESGSSFPAGTFTALVAVASPPLLLASIALSLVLPTTPPLVPHTSSCETATQPCQVPICESRDDVMTNCHKIAKMMEGLKVGPGGRCRPSLCHTAPACRHHAMIAVRLPPSSFHAPWRPAPPVALAPRACCSEATPAWTW